MAGRMPSDTSFLDFLSENLNGSFQPYAAGAKRYGQGRSAPNVGPVTGIEGYRERDLQQKVLKRRMLAKLKNSAAGRQQDSSVNAFRTPESYRRMGS